MGTPYQILFITTFLGEGGFTTNKQSNSLSKISLLQELGDGEFFQWWILCFTVSNCQATLREQGECPTVIECDTYTWQPEPWGPCLLDNPVKGCGRGERNRIVHCYSNLTSVSEVKWVHYLRLWKTGIFLESVIFTTSHSIYILPVFSFAPPKIYLFRNSLVFITVDSLTRKYGMRKNEVEKKHIIVVT